MAFCLAPAICQRSSRWHRIIPQSGRSHVSSEGLTDREEEKLDRKSAAGYNFESGCSTSTQASFDSFDFLGNEAIRTLLRLFRDYLRIRAFILGVASVLDLLELH